MLYCHQKSSVNDLLKIAHIAGAWQVVKDKGGETKGSKKDVSNVDEDVELAYEDSPEDTVLTPSKMNETFLDMSKGKAPKQSETDNGDEGAFMGYSKAGG